MSWLPEFAYLERECGGIVDEVPIYSLIWKEDPIIVRGNAVIVSS